LSDKEARRAGDKDSEVSQKIKKEWNQLLEKSVETKQAIALCSARIMASSRLVMRFMCLLASVRTISRLFWVLGQWKVCWRACSLRAVQSFLEEGEKLEASGKDLKTDCQLDLELVDASLAEKSASLEMLKTSLGKLLAASTESAS